MNHAESRVHRILLGKSERKVLELLRDAKTVKEIATEMESQPSTVYFHIRELCVKVGIPNDRGQLIRWACLHGNEVDRGVIERELKAA